MKSKKIRVGLCIPPQVLSGQSASIHNAGIGRIPIDTQKRLVEMIGDLKNIELYPELNFRNSYIRNGKVYVGDFCLNDLDIFFWYCEVDRTVGSYDIEVLKTLSFEVKVVINPRSFEVGLDKYLSHLALQRAGVSVAETVLFAYENLEYIQYVLDEWGSAVLKPRRGGFGKGVTLIQNFSALRDVVEYIHSTTGTTPDKAYLLERFYPNDLSAWTSITMIGGHIMYGYRKRASKSVDMGNGTQKIYDANEIGGEVDVCDVAPLYAKEALKAYRAIQAEVIGFDMIFYKNRPIIVDENTFPGYYEDAFKQVGKDSAEQFCNLIAAEIGQVRHV